MTSVPPPLATRTRLRYSPECRVQEKFKYIAAHDDDPVKIMHLVDPNNPAELEEPRLLQVFGRLQGLSFMNPTGREDLFGTTGKVKEINKGLKTEEMRYNLGNLTSFHNRYYHSESGVRSRMSSEPSIRLPRAPPNVYIFLETFTHTFPQPSVIARFGPRLSRALSSGALVQVGSGFRREIPVEFHKYATQEPSSWGGQEIVAEYVQQQKQIGAMIQFDMIAYVTVLKNVTLTLVASDTMDLISEHSSSPVAGPELKPEAGSDHIGDPLTQRIPSHALEFTKVAVGFAVELGVWVN
ncbi:Zn-dependent exopeptidase [Melanogaster broomeanus]|nr:Zn-dependent exopeptidase [Melanogaster broomeanus]